MELVKVRVSPGPRRAVRTVRANHRRTAVQHTNTLSCIIHRPSTPPRTGWERGSTRRATQSVLPRPHTSTVIMQDMTLPKRSETVSRTSMITTVLNGSFSLEITTTSPPGAGMTRKERTQGAIRVTSVTLTPHQLTYTTLISIATGTTTGTTCTASTSMITGAGESSASTSRQKCT